MNIPILITLFRIFSSIFLLFPLTIYYGPNFYLFILFLFVASTDFFDGYIARKYNMTSYIGGLLDPLADKILFLSTTIPFLYLKLISPFIIFGIIMRDFIIMVFREYSQKFNFSLTPSKGAKIKTAFLLVVISFTYLLNKNENSLFNNILNNNYFNILFKIILGFIFYDFINLILNYFKLFKNLKNTFFALIMVFLIKLNFINNLNFLDTIWVIVLIQSYSSLFSYFVEIKNKINI